MTATVHPADATDKTVIWETSTPSVATVSASGLVTAVSAGETVIMASAGGQSATCRVEVSVAVASVTLDKTRLNLTVGATGILTATVTPEDATDRTVVWNSTDESVASVDQDGKVTAHKGGTTSIQATAGGQSATAFVDVCEVSPGSVEVDGAGGAFDVTVVCERPYHVSSMPEWVTELSVTNQVHRFEAAANDSTRERTGVIVICDDDGNCMPCTVLQKGYLCLEPDKDRLLFSFEGGQAEVAVASTLDWTVSSDQDWCAISPVRGSLNGSFMVTVDEYRVEGSRTSTVTIKGGDLVRTVVVVQEGIVPFSVSPDTVEMDEGEGTFSVHVKSSFGYQVVGLPDWIREISAEGRNHVFRVDANPLEQDRRGVVSFCDENGTCLDVSVRQAAHLADADEVDWNKKFYHRSLFMRFTATWCGWCPRMTQTVRRAQELYPDKIVHVAIHDDSSDLYSPSVSSLLGLYQVYAFPTGIVDGSVKIQNEEVDIAAPKVVEAVKEIESRNDSRTGMVIYSSLSDREVTIRLSAFVKMAGTYNLRILLLEDHIIYPQAGTTGIYIHDDVARVSVTAPRTGDSFSVPEDKSVKTFSYKTTIPDGYDVGQMKILAYIQLDKDGGFIDNCRVVPIGKYYGLQQEGNVSEGGNEGIVPGGGIIVN